MAMSAALKEKRAKLRKKLHERETRDSLTKQLKAAGVVGMSGMTKRQMVEALIRVKLGPKTTSTHASKSGKGKKRYAGAGKGRDWHGEGPFRLLIIKGYNAGSPTAYANLGPYAAARGAIADAKTLLRQAAPVGKYQLSNKDGRAIAEFEYDGVDGYIVKAGPDWKPEDGDPPDLVAVIVQPTTEDGMLDKRALYGADTVGGRTVAKRKSMRLNKGRRNGKALWSRNKWYIEWYDPAAKWRGFYVVGENHADHPSIHSLHEVAYDRPEVIPQYVQAAVKKLAAKYADEVLRENPKRNGRRNKNVSFTTRSGEKVSFKTKKNAGKKMARTSSRIIKAQTSHARSSLTTAQHAALNSLQYQDSLQDFNPATVISLLRRGLIKKGRGNTYSLTAAGKKAPKGGGRIVDEGIYSNPRRNHHLVKGEHVKWSQQGILNVGWAGPHDKGRVTQVTKSGYVVDWGSGKPMPVPDKWLVDARSGSDYFPGSHYEGKTPRRNEGRWVRGVVKEMEEHGTVGAFTKQARAAGYKNTMEFARKVMEGWRSGKKTVYNKKTRRRQRITMRTMRRANFALNV